MNELRIDEHVMPAAHLGDPSPLVPFVVDTANLITREMVGANMSEDEARYIGYGYVDGCLPYLVQDDYDRQRRPRGFRTAVLENDLLKATFLLEMGGRLWSLYYKADNRELLFENPVFQPANLGIRDAWFSGGTEWNFCWIGHTPLTCSPLFAGRAELDDGTPVLRLWEWERVRQMPYQMDAWLPDDSPVLMVRVRLVNGDDRTVPIYWWSNIAVREEPDTRVLAPTDSTLNFDYSGKLSKLPFPLRGDSDRSYPVNSPRSGDYFFQIPRGEYPWVAAVGESGKGFFHSSTSRLIGRKLWVYGMGRGGRRWQDFLNTPGNAYIEIQGGLTGTQSECLPMDPRSEWEWLEAYGPVEADPAVVHGADWPAAWGAVGRPIEEAVSLPQLEERLAATKPMAQRGPLEVLHHGSGWGALERLRRERAGEPALEPESAVFDDDTLTEEQAPWLELLRGGALPEAPPEQPPASYIIQDQWREMLAESISAGRSDHWLGWLHMGIMHLGAKRFDEARQAWEKSVSLRPSAWGYRHLAALAMVQEDHARAAELYPLAVRLAPEYTRLVIECGKAMVSAAQAQQWLDLLETLSPSTRAVGRVRLLEAQGALAVDDLDRAGKLLEGKLEITDIREGEGGPAHLWFAYQEKRLAAAEGVPIDDKLKERVRREFPPPANLEYRLG